MSARKRKKTGTPVSYQNKDITSKILGDGFREKSLAVYGIRIPRIAESLPTNLPAIEANELRMDHLFRLEDGSYALIDYESEYRAEDKLKYLGYLVRTARRLFASGIRAPRIRMIVIYTAGVKRTETELNLGCLKLHVEAGYLSQIETGTVLSQLQKRIAEGQNLTDEELMQLIILPLTVRGKEAQQDLIETCVKLAKELKDEYQQVFAISGIMVFTDKVIDRAYAEELRRWIQMTQVGQIIAQEIEDAVKDMKKQVREMEKKLKKENTRRKDAEKKRRKAEERNRRDKLKIYILSMRLKGSTVPEIADYLDMSAAEVEAVIREDIDIS